MGYMPNIKQTYHLILGVKTCEAHEWRKTKITIAYSKTIPPETKKTSSGFYTEDDPKVYT